MVIFNSYVSLPEGKSSTGLHIPHPPGFSRHVHHVQPCLAEDIDILD